jgi:hypothetical protein
MRGRLAGAGGEGNGGRRPRPEFRDCPSQPGGISIIPEGQAGVPFRFRWEKVAVVPLQEEA